MSSLREGVLLRGSGAERATPYREQGPVQHRQPRAASAPAAAAGRGTADDDPPGRRPAGRRRRARPSGSATSTPRSWPGCASTRTRRASRPATPRACRPPPPSSPRPSAPPPSGWPTSRPAGSGGWPRRRAALGAAADPLRRGGRCRSPTRSARRSSGRSSPWSRTCSAASWRSPTPPCSTPSAGRWPWCPPTRRPSSGVHPDDLGRDPGRGARRAARHRPGRRRPGRRAGRRGRRDRPPPDRRPAHGRPRAGPGGPDRMTVPTALLDPGPRRRPARR